MMPSHLQANDNPDSSDDDEFLSAAADLPSCLESLTSSSEQLRLLANHLGQYYIPRLLCYSYLSELSNDSRVNSVSPQPAREASKSPVASSILDISKDQAALESLDTLVEALPFLNELCNLVEQCFLTIESTMKRCTYYLNKACERQAAPVNLDMISHDDEFQLTIDTKMHSIFVSLMDLAYALVSVDKTIQSHASSLGPSLTSLKATCELLIQTELLDPTAQKGSPSIDSDDFSKLPRNRIANLVEYVSNIQLTLCNQSRSIFQQCIEHLQHLNLHLSSGDRTSKGFKNLCQHFEEFIEFYGEHLIEVNYHNLANNFASISTAGATAQPLPLGQLKSNLIVLINLNMIPTMYMTASSRRLFGICSLFILYSWLFKKPNKRLVRAMMQLLNRFKALNLTHFMSTNCYIKLDEFLAKHLPKSLLDARTLKQLAEQDEQLLKFSTADDLERFTLKVMPWMVQLKAETLAAKNLHDVGSTKSSSNNMMYSRQLNLFTRGLQLAEELNYSIKSFIAIYLHHNKPMSKRQLVPLMRLVALLKSIEDAMKHAQLFVYQCSLTAESSLRNEWKQLMLRTKKRLISVRYSERQLDTSSMLKLTSICSRASHLSTDQGRDVISLCLPMLMASMNADELIQINKLMALIHPISNYERHLREATNCSYLFWSWPTLSTYYNYALEEDPCSIDEIPYIHMALDDIPRLFDVLEDRYNNGGGREKERGFEFIKKLGLELMDQFKVDFLDKLCQELEIELRLQTHRELHLDGHNPFRRHLYNFKVIFGEHKAPRIFRILNQQVSLQHHVEQHLNRVCYNLTALAPHDWFTYDSMINLAKIRYGLQLANTQLPTQSLECGLDLLDITRHLAHFMARYSYDLTNQLFIEKCSNRLSNSASSSVFSASMLQSSATMTTRSTNLNLSLNVIQVKHIAKSIQTHGYGVLNSSVNCTYQVMKRLINLFAKQMADDKLRATLAKEQLAIINSGGKQAAISFDRATRMAKKFKLSLANQANIAEHNKMGTDLDSLRQSITQLGNLLGFIRMLKSGALSCASRSADYLPDLDNLQVDMSKSVRSEFARDGITNLPDSNLTSHLLRASENFDQCLADLDEHFSPKTNYFGIVIHLFRQSLAVEPNLSGASSKLPDEQQKDPSTNRSDVDKTGDVDGGGGGGKGTTMECSTPKTVNSEETSRKEMRQTDKSSSSSSNKRAHLSLFSMLVPALTINYIEYIINCKERAQSRSSATRFGALISDDGFSMGVAFLLEVLGQSQSFARLEWFKEIETKLVEDKREVEQRLLDSRYEESLKQTSSMTLRRINRLQTEYKSLNYTLSSGLLFFRSSTFVDGEQGRGEEFSHQP